MPCRVCSGDRKDFEERSPLPGVSEAATDGGAETKGHAECTDIRADERPDVEILPQGREKAAAEGGAESHFAADLIPGRVARADNGKARPTRP
jgi:hypothetical protein